VKPVESIAMEPGLLRMPPGLGEHQPGEALPFGPLVRRIAERLDEAGIEWAVLRNAEGLPNFTRYDIDLLISPRRGPAAVRLIESCAADTGWRVIGRIRKRHYLCLMLVYGEGEEAFFLPIDLFTALEYRGLRYLDAAAVLTRRIRTPAGIWALPTGLEAAITLLKEWFPHGVLKENSRGSVQALAASDPDGFRAALAAAAGEDWAARAAEAVRTGRWQLSQADARALRRAIRRRQPDWPLIWAAAALANLRHLFRPSLGAVVALAGADGSGKTTLARELCARLYRRPFKACRYIHGNIGVLPRFRDMRARLRRAAGFKQAPSPPEPAELKGMMKPLPAWKSVVLAAYYALDLGLARWRLRRWRCQWMLVVMDRSFADYAYQLGHRNCPRWILAVLSRLIPRPDRLLCIEDDPEAIHVRKPELTAEEIRTEQQILRGLVERMPHARMLDGRGGINALAAAACREVRAGLPGEVS